MCVAGGGEGSIAAPAQQSRLVAERRWRLAMQSQAHPSSIMRDLLACLQQNQVSWKKQAPYNFKCRKAIGPAGVTLHNFLVSRVACCWVMHSTCTADFLCASNMIGNLMHHLGRESWECVGASLHCVTLTCEAFNA